MNISLVTPRMILRPFLITDAERIAHSEKDGRDNDACPARPPSPAAIDRARQWISTHEELFHRNNEINLVAVAKLDQAVIGTFRLAMDLLNKRAALGFWIAREHRKQGYCTEASSAIVTYGFQKLGLIRIEGLCKPGNCASAKVLTNIGMQKEGLLRKYVVQSGVSEDVSIYSVLNTHLVPDISGRE